MVIITLLWNQNATMDMIMNGKSEKVWCNNMVQSHKTTTGGCKKNKGKVGGGTKGNKIVFLF